MRVTEDYTPNRSGKNSLLLQGRISNGKECICNLNFVFCRYYLRSSLCVSSCFSLCWLWLVQYEHCRASPVAPQLRRASRHQHHLFPPPDVPLFDMRFHLVSLFSFSSWRLGKSVETFNASNQDWLGKTLLANSPMFGYSKTEHGFQPWLEGKSLGESHSCWGRGRCREYGWRGLDGKISKQEWLQVSHISSPF